MDVCPVIAVIKSINEGVDCFGYDKLSTFYIGFENHDDGKIAIHYFPSDENGECLFSYP